MTILRTDKLAVGYGKKIVVSDINVALLEGQFVCLLGPNGSGKSTILKTLVRMLAPLGGGVFLNDRDTSRLSSQDMARTTAVVLTEPVTPGLLTAYDVVMLGRHPHTGFMGKPTGKDTRKVLEALALVRADELAHRYFNELSDGEKQKVLLARALAQEPQLIVLDEPTSHLDARHRIEVMLILRRLTQEKGVTVVASLHDIDLAMKACDVALLVKDEHILACGTPEDVLKEDLVAQLYGMDHATFSGQLGGVELRANQDGKRVFVVAGAGSGASVYRALTKHGFGIITGILPENDIDYHVAAAVGATIIKSAAFEELSRELFSEGLKQIDAVEQVIDAGFPVGKWNRQNSELVWHALGTGKAVFTFREKVEAEKLYGSLAARLVYCRDFFELMRGVRLGMGNRPSSQPPSSTK
ncbi:MAG: ABC transporter ATP-binding protein [Dehalococcoidia bacterium]|nr:ABC transporter ATP-binding protein [Dehalococcoidia bacterium]